MSFPRAIVRCSRGHLFTTIWIPLVSLKAIRLGERRAQRCPFCRQWRMVEPIDPASLTSAERAEAAEVLDTRIP
jgi:hypothetical protein